MATETESEVERMADTLNQHQVTLLTEWPADQMGEDWWVSPKDAGIASYWMRDLADKGIMRSKPFQGRWVYQFTETGRRVAASLSRSSRGY